MHQSESAGHRLPPIHLHSTSNSHLHLHPQHRDPGFLTCIFLQLFAIPASQSRHTLCIIAICTLTLSGFHCLHYITCSLILYSHVVHAGGLTFAFLHQTSRAHVPPGKKCTCIGIQSRYSMPVSRSCQEISEPVNGLPQHYAVHPSRSPLTVHI